MAQCLYLDATERRCPREAEGESSFCLWHESESSAPPPLLGAGLRRWIFRLVALLLLAIFLIPLVVQAYRVVRGLIR